MNNNHIWGYGFFITTKPTSMAEVFPFGKAGARFLAFHRASGSTASISAWDSNSAAIRDMAISPWAVT